MSCYLTTAVLLEVLFRLLLSARDLWYLPTHGVLFPFLLDVVSHSFLNQLSSATPPTTTEVHTAVVDEKVYYENVTSDARCVLQSFCNVIIGSCVIFVKPVKPNNGCHCMCEGSRQRCAVLAQCHLVLHNIVMCNCIRRRFATKLSH